MGLLISGAAQLHPAELVTPNPLPQGYGTDQVGFPQSLSNKDLTFHAPYPAAGTLSSIERYMVAGGELDGRRMLPWKESVLNAVRAIHETSGSFPSRLDSAALGAAYGGAALPPDQRPEMLLNPLTSQPLRFDAAEFSAGDVYIRPLTTGEIRYFCNTDRTLADIYLRNQFLSPSSGKYEAAQLVGAVYYMRTYGRGGVLDADIYYKWTVSMGAR